MNFSVEEEVQRDEIIQALKCVESNYSFASTNGDRKRFEAIFPIQRLPKDISKIKQKLNIQYGIYPYLKDLLLEDLKRHCFHI